MLIQRILGAAIIVAVVSLPVILGGLPFLLLIMLVSTLAVVELGRMFSRVGYRPLYVASVGLTAAIVLDAYLETGLLDLAITVGVLAPLVWLVFRGSDFGRAAIEWTVTVIGPFYLGWTLARFVLLRELPDGLAWAGAALLGTWAADIGAYFAGRAFGNHKLYPRVSPAKTWEGVGGGVLLAVVVLAVWMSLAQGYGLVSRPGEGWPLWSHGAVLGLLVSCAAVIGDLAESFLKRATGLKDAGRVIPGHGGLLDRVDSLVFSVPLVYYYVVYAV